VLAKRGLIEVIPGRGTFVAQPSDGALRDSLRLMVRLSAASPDELVDARELLEVELAGRAAQRASAQEVEQLERDLADLEDHRADVGGFLERDLAFHSHVGDAAHHAVLNAMLKAFRENIFQTMTFNLGQPLIVERAIGEHRALVEAVKAGDPEAARQAARQHLQPIHRTAQRMARGIAET
jgi:DNA-binding FadR family transcriptional regulator